MTLDQRTRRLSEEPVGKLLWSFSLPAIAGMFVASLYTVIDRAFLGHAVGPDAIGGLSICMPIAFVIMAVGMLIGLGSGALVSIRLGQQKRDEAEAILGNAVTMTVIASVVLSGIFLATLDVLLTAFGATAATLPHAREFMHVILLGSFFQYASFGLNAIIRAEGNPRLAMLTQLINAGLNVLLDALFIFGFGWGVTGAAVATVLSQAVSAAWTLGHFRSERSVLKLRLKHLRPRWEILRPALAIGLAPFTMHVVGSVTILLLNRGLSRYGGDAAISAYGIISSLSMLFMMPVFGINQGAQPIIGFNYGAGQLDRVRRTLKLAILSASLVVLGGFGVVQLVPEPLLGVFAKDPDLLEIGAHGMRICLLMMPLVGFQVVASNFFQAIGRGNVALVLTLLRQVIVLFPLLLILPGRFGLNGVWAAGPVSDLVSTVLTGVALAWQLRSLRGGPQPRSAPEGDAAMRPGGVAAAAVD